MAAASQVYLSWHCALAQHGQRLCGLKKQMDAMLTGAGSLTLFAVALNCTTPSHLVPSRLVLLTEQPCEGKRAARASAGVEAVKMSIDPTAETWSGSFCSID